MGMHIQVSTELGEPQLLFIWYKAVNNDTLPSEICGEGRGGGGGGGWGSINHRVLLCREEFEKSLAQENRTFSSDKKYIYSIYQTDGL